MARTIKGSKGPCFEFCARRSGNAAWSGGVGSSYKGVTHRKERMQSKRIVRERAKEAGVQ